MSVFVVVWGYRCLENESNPVYLNLTPFLTVFGRGQPSTVLKDSHER